MSTQGTFDLGGGTTPPPSLLEDPDIDLRGLATVAYVERVNEPQAFDDPYVEYLDAGGHVIDWESQPDNLDAAELAELHHSIRPAIRFAAVVRPATRIVGRDRAVMIDRMIDVASGWRSRAGMSRLPRDGGNELALVRVGLNAHAIALHELDDAEQRDLVMLASAVLIYVNEMGRNEVRARWSGA